jgi:hypothetical protein
MPFSVIPAKAGIQHFSPYAPVFHHKGTTFDIDLAVKGIAPERFFEAVAFATGQSLNVENVTYILMGFKEKSAARSFLIL